MRRGKIAGIALTAALSLAAAGCGGSSYDGPTAVDVEPEGNLAYQDFQETSRSFINERLGRGTNADQLATQEVAWRSPSPFKMIDVMSWYSQRYTDAGWGACPDTPAPDLSSDRIDYCKTVDERPHHATLRAGTKGATTASDFRITYVIGQKIKPVKR